MIWVFDLDETLYEERAYVLSGLDAVSDYLGREYSIDSALCFEIMCQEFQRNGRKRVFQQALQYFELPSELVEIMLKHYQNHVPSISLYRDAEEVLDQLRKQRIYLVTDGASRVQWKKIESLKLGKNFEKIYVTDDFGPGAAKPSTLCFNEIRIREKSDWHDLVYVGDDPNKDFISLNPLGVNTVRVNRGRFKDKFVSASHEAQFTVNDLSNLIEKASKYFS
jgi:putative hydrolase of the HAD superfamily